MLIILVFPKETSITTFPASYFHELEHFFQVSSHFLALSCPCLIQNHFPHLTSPRCPCLVSPHDPCLAPPCHLTPSSTPCLALLSMPRHEPSSSHLICPNQPFIPSPRLEKSRGGLAREKEFLANQAHLSVQASPKNRKIQKKNSHS